MPHGRPRFAFVVEGKLRSDDGASSIRSIRRAAPTVLAPRRVFVQARPIFCFAKAAQLGWYPDGREIALKGLDYI